MFFSFASKLKRYYKKQKELSFEVKPRKKLEIMTKPKKNKRTKAVPISLQIVEPYFLFSIINATTVK